MTTWIAIGIQTLLVLGAVAGIYAKIGSRLTAIEVRLQIADASKDSSREANVTATKLLLIEHCQGAQKECPARREHDQWASPSQVTSPGKG